MVDELFHDIESCPIHEDEYLRECNICGNHFCTRCFQRSLVCEDCSEDDDDTDMINDDEDLSELADYEDLLDSDDDEIDRLIEESELLPLDDIDHDDDEF